MVHGGRGTECESQRGMYQAFEAEVTLKVIVLAGPQLSIIGIPLER